MKKLLILILFPLIVSAQHYTPAKAYKNLNLKRFEDNSRSRTETYAYLSFIIGLNGKPNDIVIVNASNARDFPEAISYVKNLRYTPASINNKPVEAETRYLLRYDKSLLGYSNEGVTKGFNKLYNQIKDNIKAGQLADAKTALAALDKKTRNLSEQSHYAWLASLYFSTQSDWQRYGDETFNAWVLRHYLHPDIAQLVTKNLYEYAIHKQQFRLALEATESLTQLKGVTISKSVYNEFLDGITKAMAKAPVISTKFTVPNKQYLYHKLSREHINVSGKAISAIELRCANGITKVTIGDAYQIDDTLEDCRLLVRASPDSTVTIEETGLNHLRL